MPLESIIETSDAVPVSFTDAAVRALREFSSEAGTLLRIGVKGGGCAGFEYDVAFDTARETEGIAFTTAPIVSSVAMRVCHARRRRPHTPAATAQRAQSSAIGAKRKAAEAPSMCSSAELGASAYAVNKPQSTPAIATMPNSYPPPVWWYASKVAGSTATPAATQAAVAGTIQRRQRPASVSSNTDVRTKTNPAP